jgi:hypothetical protein
MTKFMPPAEADRILDRLFGPDFYGELPIGSTWCRQHEAFRCIDTGDENVDRAMRAAERIGIITGKTDRAAIIAFAGVIIEELKLPIGPDYAGAFRMLKGGL